MKKPSCLQSTLTALLLLLLWRVFPVPKYVCMYTGSNRRPFLLRLLLRRRRRHLWTTGGRARGHVGEGGGEPKHLRWKRRRDNLTVAGRRKGRLVAQGVYVLWDNEEYLFSRIEK